MSNAYALTQNNYLLNHAPARPSLVEDIVSGNRNELIVQVSSGDYFATLATRLNQMSQDIVSSNKADSELLEQIVDDLIYLQTNYSIKKK